MLDLNTAIPASSARTGEMMDWAHGARIHCKYKPSFSENENGERDKRSQECSVRFKEKKVRLFFFKIHLHIIYHCALDKFADSYG